MHLRCRRRAATMVECSIVFPVTLLLVMGLLIGSMGMFRYQEMATLAREAARYAAVHGTGYAKDAGTPAPTPDQIYAAAVTSKAVGLDLSRLSYSITYNTSNAPNHMNIVGGDVTPYPNTVTVTLTYNWVPEAFLGGITLTSTSQSIMYY